MNEYSPEESEPLLTPKPRPPKPSMAPSWAMLGFAFGALFILALPRREPPVPSQPAELPAITAARRAVVSAPQFTTIENVFAELGRSAVWQNDLTEVALFNADTKNYSDFYEVLRSGDAFYIRTIPKLTRPLLTHGVDPSAALQFTEPQARRDEWLREKSQATTRAFLEAAKENFPSSNAKPPEERK